MYTHTHTHTHTHIYMNMPYSLSSQMIALVLNYAKTNLVGTLKQQ